MKETSNEALKPVYDEMHTQGPSAWFDDGAEEREAILKMGEPWYPCAVIEIGCGEGDLLNMMAGKGASVWGIDYSEEAIKKAKEKYPSYKFTCENYRDLPQLAYHRIVLQGVLEHLDNPWEEMKWILDNIVVDGGGDIITSSPMFCNPRGYVWMAYAAIGAVMSKTDLHFLHPWEFETFARENGCKLEWTSCEHSWANGVKLIEDFKKRLPLAFRDGDIDFNSGKVQDFLNWLKKSAPLMDLGPKLGAVGVYRITKG